jgi:uncharacterized protein (TIGR02145 family)
MRNIFTIGILIVSFSITLKAQDTMYVHQSGGTITKIAVNKIDSIIFYAVTTGDTIEPIPDDTIVTDFDGNIYNTLTIGTQVWLAENLKTTKYNDGTPIPLVTDNTEWSNLTTPAYCWYDNDSSAYSETYGALYNWYVVETNNLCPTGWHVPSDAEWTTLATYLGGVSVAGGKLKETGTTHWNSPNTGATNDYGFTALPGGYRYLSETDDSYSSINKEGRWWSTTVNITVVDSWIRIITNNGSDLGRYTSSKEYGFSVRCIKD